MSLMSVPTTYELSNSTMPDSSLSIPNSLPPQHMPKLSTPASFAGLIFKPLTFPPTLAKNVFKPTLTFGAPQTTCTGAPLPSFTVKMCNFWLLGWCSTVKISATTTFSMSLPTNSTPSISAVDNPNLFVNSSTSMPSRLT